MNAFNLNTWMERIDRTTDAVGLAAIGLELVEYLNSLPENERADVRRTMEAQLTARFDALNEKLTDLKHRYGHATV